MNRFILLSLTLLFVNIGWTETERDGEEILQQKQVVLPMYRLRTSLMEAIVINMPYAGATIDATYREKLKGAIVTKIDLVYTDFPIGKDLTELNLRRIETIRQLREDLVTDRDIIWRVYKQNICRNEAEAQVLFHGIVIHYRPKQSEETIKKDLYYVSSTLPSEDSLDAFKDYGSKLPDTTIFAVFNRNKGWKKMHVIADLTGSMAPYSVQLAIWFHLNQDQKRLNNVTFFNDGDQKVDAYKRIGSTGGIYQGKAKNYSQLKHLMVQTISNGNGGDIAENDCEAILNAIKIDPNASEYVLIADNMAPIKDLILMEYIDRPVRIVLCGTFFGINTQYLNLARKTGGSIHTIEQDIIDLASKKEGDYFPIGRHMFTIKDDIIIKYK